MSVELNHTLVQSRDKDAGSHFLANVLGLRPPIQRGMLSIVQVSNGVSLDFIEEDPNFSPQHYAFLVDDETFDQIFKRVRSEQIPYFPDAFHTVVDEINTRGGGRGLYFNDLDGHNIEVLTRDLGPT